jgi:hypothetical protein
VKEIPSNAGASDRIRDFVINQLVRGRSNCTGTVTLTASASSTTVTNNYINANSKPMLCPTTANAAAALATTYISAVAAGSFTITHANNAQVDKTFYWLGLGG